MSPHLSSWKDLFNLLQNRSFQDDKFGLKKAKLHACVTSIINKSTETKLILNQSD